MLHREEVKLYFINLVIIARFTTLEIVKLLLFIENTD